MPSIPTFPERSDYAHVLWLESVRHLQDCYVLHAAARFPASISSAMKATEIAVKSLLVLDGAMAWWERLHGTHTPFTDIERNPILKRHYVALEGHDPDLPGRVKELERLAPSRPGSAGYDLLGDRTKQEANPEYPFFTAKSDPATQTITAELLRPASFFDASASLDYCRVAHRFLSAIAAQYPEIAAWSVDLPPIP